MTSETESFAFILAKTIDGGYASFGLSSGMLTVPYAWTTHRIPMHQHPGTVWMHFRDRLKAWANR